MSEMNILVCISLQLRHHVIGGTEAGVTPEGARSVLEV